MSLSHDGKIARLAAAMVIPAMEKAGVKNPGDHPQLNELIEDYIEKCRDKLDAEVRRLPADFILWM